METDKAVDAERVAILGQSRLGKTGLWAGRHSRTDRVAAAVWGTAEDDQWSDSKGEFVAAVAAGPVYHSLVRRGLETGRMPAVNQPIVRDIGYYCRTGQHEPIGFRLAGVCQPALWQTMSADGMPCRAYF
jgi:hypothetical protein